MDRASDGLRDRQKTQKSGVMMCNECNVVHKKSQQIMADPGSIPQYAESKTHTACSAHCAAQTMT